MPQLKNSGVYFEEVYVNGDSLDGWSSVEDTFSDLYNQYITLMSNVFGGDYSTLPYFNIMVAFVDEAKNELLFELAWGMSCYLGKGKRGKPYVRISGSVFKNKNSEMWFPQFENNPDFDFDGEDLDGWDVNSINEFPETEEILENCFEIVNDGLDKASALRGK